MYSEKSGFATFLNNLGILWIILSAIGGFILAVLLEDPFYVGGIFLALVAGLNGILIGFVVIGAGLALEYLHEIRDFTSMEKNNSAEIVELLKKNSNSNVVR